jgi:mono/diheme cytochrome c family protein
MKYIASLGLAFSLLVSTQVLAVDYARQIAPLLNQKCAECHSAKRNKTKGDFAIDRLEDMQKQVKAGEPQKSSLLITVSLPDDDEDVMPPKGKNKMNAAQLALLKQWIEEGANFTAQATPPPAAPTGAPATPGGAPAAQKWTNAAGKEIEATFEGMQGADTVLLKVTATGLVHAVPLSSLSAASQELAKKGGM